MIQVQTPGPVREIPVALALHQSHICRNRSPLEPFMALPNLGPQTGDVPRPTHLHLDYWNWSEVPSTIRTGEAATITSQIGSPSTLRRRVEHTV